MKILRIFGVVVGVHVFALMLIFVNPGCSSTNKPPPPAAETAADETPAPVESAPEIEVAEASPIAPAPVVAPAEAPPVVRFSPTRPGTPAAQAIEASPVSDVVPAKTYTVAAGDSLWTIARKNQLTVAELAAANNIRPNAIVRIGQKLIIPAKAVAGSSVSVADPAETKTAATPPPARAATETIRHVVRPGETLGGIARRYGVRVGEIATANNIADPRKIRPGMELTIPGWQPTASRASKSSEAPPPARASSQPPAPAEEVPTLVLPPPEENTAPANEPPVIKVDEP